MCVCVCERERERERLRSGSWLWVAFGERKEEGTWECNATGLYLCFITVHSKGEYMRIVPAGT